MASTSFRDSMNSLGWSRREQIASTSTSNQSGIYGTIQKLNPFNSEGYLRLPTHENEDGPGAPLPQPTRRQEEEGWFALSRWDKLLIFGGLNAAAIVLFIVCFTLFPVLALKPTKFAIIWSMASLLFLSSWAVLMGPWIYVQHLLSKERVPFTATYFGSIALTLYFALGLRSKLLTLVSAVIQLVALVWYAISYFPMGSQGLRFATRFGGSQIASWVTG